MKYDHLLGVVIATFYAAVLFIISLIFIKDETILCLVDVVIWLGWVVVLLVIKAGDE